MLRPLVVGSLMLVAGVAFAQSDGPAPGDTPQLVDRIVAIVDEEPVLLSDLEREIESYVFERQSMGQPVTEDEAEIRRSMLDRLIEVKLMVAQAKADGLVIGEEELEGNLQQAMRDIESRFGSRAALEAELAQAGLTYEDLVARNREIVRNRMYSSRILDVYVRPQVEVRDDEVQTFYEESRDQIPRRPATVTLGNVLVVPQPDESTRERVEGKLRSARQALSAGNSFADVAREFSEGPNAARGGAVGRFARGDLFSPVLEEIAWKIPVGQVSEPINTELGTHLIVIDDRTEDQVALSQILFRVEVSDGQREAARQRADEVATKARAGQDFTELVRTYSDDPAATENDGVLGTFEPERLSATFRAAIEGLEVGGVTDPVPGAAGFFVLKVLDREEGAVYSFDEVEGRLRDILFQQKAESKLDEFVDSLRERFYIEVKV